MWLLGQWGEECPQKGSSLLWKVHEPVSRSNLPLIQQTGFHSLVRPGIECSQTILPSAGQGWVKTLSCELLAEEDTSNSFYLIVFPIKYLKISNSFSSPQITKANYLVYIFNRLVWWVWYIPVYAHTCASTLTLHWMSSSIASPLYFFTETGFLTKLSAHSFGQTDWPASPQDLPVSVYQSWNLQTGHTQFYVGARDPSVCPASALPSEPSPGSISLPFKRKESQDTMTHTYNLHTQKAEAEGLL